MAPLTPDQVRTRERVETVIRIAAPALNLVLAVGERVSKLVEPEDHEYYPPRTSTQGRAPAAAQVSADATAPVGGRERPPVRHPGLPDRGC